MLAIPCRASGHPDVLQVSHLPDPVPAADEVLIQVRAAGVNRADLLQRRGLYPPPAGASDLLGLECSGTVVSAPPGSDLEPGMTVMALLPGGGYASLVTAHHGCVIAVPNGWSLESAAAFPEVWTTAYLNLVKIGEIHPGTRLLVHGGSGGVGTASIQLARLFDARIAVTAGGPDRCRLCRDLGAEAAFDYREDTWPEKARRWAGTGGIDVILDCIGAKYLSIHQKLLTTNGRLIVIGLMGGGRAELDLARLLQRRQSVVGSTLRHRSPGEKAEIIRALMKDLTGAIEDGSVAPVVHRVFPLAQAGSAHQLLEGGGVFGKLVLEVPETLAAETGP